MNLYQQAIEKFGVENQINQTIEECAELIVALSHWKRDKCLRNNILEEIAGVENTLKQMKLVFDPYSQDYDKIKTDQMRKLKKHLEAQ